MPLKALNIHFRSLEQLFSEVDEALDKKKPVRDKKNELKFDSPSTFQKVMSRNRLQILIAISRLKPDSIYQLEKILGRPYPHVLKDCRTLEGLGFIKLVETNRAKKQLRPKLSFDYDIVKINAQNPNLTEILNISERSNRLLLEVAAS